MTDVTSLWGPGTDTGHGHVWERLDGMRARCGGPPMCGQCARDTTRLEQAKAAERRGDEDMLAHYSAALDEIYRLRVALAYEARIVEAHLELAGFPKSRRPFAEQQVERMRAAVRGDAVSAYADVSTGAGKGLLLAAGASQTLTRFEWEERSRG